MRVKTWDKWVSVLAAGVLPMASWVVSGLDVRFGWTRAMGLGTHLAGLLIRFLGLALFMWAMAANAFFAEGVRIQGERGHSVASGGPCRFVRHPGYLGAIIAKPVAPLLLGSSWAWIPSVASVSG